MLHHVFIYLTICCRSGPQKRELTDEEILIMLRKAPKNKWEDLAQKHGFNLKKYRKMLEDEEKKKREAAELVFFTLFSILAAC